MKHIIFSILFSLVLLPLKAQSDSINYKHRNNVFDIESNMLDIESNMLKYTYNQNPGYIHIKNAGRFHRKAYALEIAFIPLSVASGYMTGYGYVKKKADLKWMGYIIGGAAIADAIAALTFHFKTGKELQLSADHILFKF